MSHKWNSNYLYSFIITLIKVIVFIKEYNLSSFFKLILSFTVSLKSIYLSILNDSYSSINSYILNFSSSRNY